MDSIDKINILLAKHGMSGADLSRLIGVSNSVYSQWNTKTTKPSNKSLAKIAEVFSVDVAALMPDNEKKPALKNENELDDTTKELVELAYELDDADRQMLLEMARSIRRRREG
jgi:transcriptional regulator with XRE-family HTH domain